MTATDGRPTLIGDVVFGNLASSVAVCTLASRSLLAHFAGQPEVAIAGRVFTENIGIERMIQNLATQPGLRVLILCGRESRHHVGQTILSLHRLGLDEEHRVIGSTAPEPFLPNLRPEELHHFQQRIEVVDMIGELEAEVVLTRARFVAASADNAAEGADSAALENSTAAGRYPVEVIKAVSDDSSAWRYDEAGFFLIFPDRGHRDIRVEHYGRDRTLRRVVHARRAQDICHTLLRLGLVTDLAHAAYLGRELAKAEAALRLGLHFEQDSPLDPRLTI